MYIVQSRPLTLSTPHTKKGFAKCADPDETAHISFFTRTTVFAFLAHLSYAQDEL